MAGFLTKKKTLSANGASNADVNEDNKLNVIDMKMMKNKLLS